MNYIIEWVDELFDYAMERQPSVELAHISFRSKLEKARVHSQIASSVAKDLTRQSSTARKRVAELKDRLKEQMTWGNTTYAKNTAREFFQQLELTTMLETQSSQMQKQSRRVVLQIVHLGAIERRLYLLSLFLAPLPAFKASEHDDYAKMLKDIWEFVSGDLSQNAKIHTFSIDKFERLESNALREFEYIDENHVARMRTSDRRKFAKKVTEQLALLAEEHAIQTKTLCTLIERESYYASHLEKFEAYIAGICRKHCEKQLLRLDVYSLILSDVLKILSTPIAKHS